MNDFLKKPLVKVLMLKGEKGETGDVSKENFDKSINSLTDLISNNRSRIDDANGRIDDAQNGIKNTNSRIDNLIVSSGSDSSAEVIDARIGADGTKYLSVGDAIRGQYSKLNNDLSDWYRLEGLERGNLVEELTLEKENKYAYATKTELGTNPIFGPHEGYNVYVLDIEPSNYVFNEEIRTIVLADANGYCVTETINFATSVDNTSINAKKMYMSIPNPDATLKNLIISKGDTLKTLDIFPEHTGIPKMQNSINNINDSINIINDSINNINDSITNIKDSITNINNLRVSRSKDSFNENENIILSNARSNLRKGIRCVFECEINSGSNFEFGFTISQDSLLYTHNKFVFKNDVIEYYEDYAKNDVQVPTETYNHNLSFNNILQLIFEYKSKGDCSLTLICDGETFKINRDFTMASVAVPYVKSNGLIGTNAKFSFTCSDLLKNIWVFGDSYVSYSPTRWTYYLSEYGYDDNILLDGFPGMSSVNARFSLETLLKLNKPTVVVWAEGMNDGNDVNINTASEEWATERDKVIKLCNEKNIQLIFATIPNVPTVNNIGKNYWIRNSGYKYIDMAKAVGSDLNVNWYDGMLSQDKVHPSEKGARALFAQVLLDFPEVMIKNL